MSQSIYGAYHAEWDAPLSTLRLSLPRLDLVSSWRRCSLIADFVAEFLCDNFEDPDVALLNLSTILNEVLENAVKFSLPGAHDVKLAAPFWGDRLTLELRHACEPGQAERLGACIARLEGADPEELFVQQLEATAAESPEISGLGLITLTKDYQAHLGLCVLPITTGVVKVAFQVHLPAHTIDRS